MSKRTSLSELMGSHAASQGGSLSLEHLPQILGDAMPELPRNAVGRIRLIRSLKARFGPNFRALPGVSNIVRDFDQAIVHEGRIAKISAIKLAPLKEKK